MNGTFSNKREEEKIDSEIQTLQMENKLLQEKKVEWYGLERKLLECYDKTSLAKHLK